LIFNFLVFLREEGTAKTFGTLAVEPWSFKRQCDCFVTKRLTDELFALKEVTNQLRHSRRIKQCLWGQSEISIGRISQYDSRKGAKTQREFLIFLCAFARLRE
jgi:hypothetical protein